jgi:thioredoxin 2
MSGVGEFMATSEVTCPNCGKRNRVPVAASGRPRCAQCQSDLPWLVPVGSSDFTAAVDSRLPVLVDLWAPWCGPCRMVAPVLERMAEEFAGRLKVVKVNVDEAPDVQARYGVRGIPTLLLLRDGDEVDRVVGAVPDHVLREHVEGVLAAPNAT